MKFDYYCLALVVLVLFFLYLDNYNNLEGFAALEEEGGEGKQKNKNDSFGGKVKEHSEVIGQVPKKIPTKPPPSMANGLLAVESYKDNLTSLDSAFSPLFDKTSIQKQVPTNLLNNQARFGGQGNIGSDMIGTIGAPVKPFGSDKVQGIPVLDNQVLGAPIEYKLDTNVLLSGVKPASTSEVNKPGIASSSSKKKLELHMVYTNWCGHSKRAMPDFDKVANEINGSTMGNHKVSVVKHDADTSEGKAFAKEHGVRGFPTHFLIVEGKKIESGVGRTYDEIMNKIKSLTGV
jgi:thiol-disulfide isomerase/thioredoxin